MEKERRTEEGTRGSLEGGEDGGQVMMEHVDVGGGGTGG